LTVPVVEALRTLDDEDASAVGVEGAGLSGAGADADADAAALPKLKPLHWDKVRASSDRVMVWDQLKSSSFQ